MNQNKLRIFFTPTNLFIIFITLLGAFFRLLSFQYNEIPHGDIYLDYAAGLSFLETGKLTLPFITDRPYLEPRVENGIYLEQHPPLWPLLGGLFANFNGDVFLTFKLLSFILGVSMIPISYWVFNRVFNKKTALLTITIIAFSYILIDYSGNGSLYILHSLLYVLAVNFVRTDKLIYSAILGVLFGLLYLLNYQSVIVVFALITVFIMKYGFTKTLKNNFYHLVISLVCMAVTILPWTIRNNILFEDSTFSAHIGYVFSNLGIPSEVIFVDKYLLKRVLWDQYNYWKIPGLVFKWFVRNLIYFIGRIIVLAPMVSFFVPFAYWQVISKRKNKEVNEGVLMTVILSILHIAISCFWPVFKFRYLVPLLPLLISIGSYGVFLFVNRLKVQKFVVFASVIGVIIVSFITFYRVPSHTNYYDSNEFFHYRTGEVEWLATERLLIDVTAHIPTSDSSYPIIGPKVSLFYHAKRPIVLVNSIKEPEIIEKLIQLHNIEYIIDLQDRYDFYSGFVNTIPLYKNEEFFLLAIDQK